MPPGDRVSCSSPGSQTAAWPAPSRRTTPSAPGHLGLAREHDEELAADRRVPPDGATGRQRDRDEVGVGAQAEGADGEAAAPVRLDRTVREVRQVEDPHAPPAAWSAGGV